MDDPMEIVRKARSLPNNVLMNELATRISETYHEYKEINSRAVDLESALYAVLKHRMVKLEDYKAALSRLEPHKNNLRMPMLYDLLEKRAKE